MPEPLIESATVGGAGVTGFTVTVAELAGLVPPEPVHVRVYVTGPELNGPTVTPVLEGACAPVQPSDPVPPPGVQVDALLLDQARLVDPPAVTVLGVAVNDAILGVGGRLFTVTLMELGGLVPPTPEHVSV